MHVASHGAPPGTVIGPRVALHARTPPIARVIFSSPHSCTPLPAGEAFVEDGLLQGGRVSRTPDLPGLTYDVLPAPARLLSLVAGTGIISAPTQATVTLDRPAPSGGAVVTLATTDAALATVPPAVTIPEGATSADVTHLDEWAGARPAAR